MLLCGDVLQKVVANSIYDCGFNSASDFFVTLLDNINDGKSFGIWREVIWRTPHSDSMRYSWIKKDSAPIGNYQFNEDLTEVRLYYTRGLTNWGQSNLDNPLDDNFFNHFHKDSNFLIRLSGGGSIIDSSTFSYADAKEYLDVTRENLKSTSKLTPKSRVINSDWFVIAGKGVVIDLFLKEIR